MHGWNRVFGQPALNEARPGVGAGAIMRPFWRVPQGLPSVHNGNGNSLNGQSGHQALGGYAWDSKLHGGLMHSSPFSGRVAPCAPPLWSWTTDEKEIHGNNADVEGATGGRTAGWQGARQVCQCMAIQPRYTAATPDLPTTILTPPLRAYSSYLHCWSRLTTKCSRSQPMPCRSWPASYHNASPHIQHYPHSQEVFQCLFPCLPSSHSHITPIRMSFAWFCSHLLLLVRFCSQFFVFLTFFSFGGICG